MKPRIEISAEKKLVGERMTMSFATYNVSELWKSFMPRRKEIPNPLNADLISMTIYNVDHFTSFNQTNEFEKWAAIEVPDFHSLPDGMDSFLLSRGLYAVFHYKGLNTDDAIYKYIYLTWLPASDYDLDDRPHFEVLGNKYRNNDPESEEEIWIPIKPKK